MSVTVEKYHLDWPQNFQQIKSKLEGCLRSATYISIEHVGSTSVHGLAARPIVDVDIIVTSDNVQVVIDALVSHGKFYYLGDLGRHIFEDPDSSPPRNIYVCIDGDTQAKNHLGLRNTLRSSPDLRDEYACLKFELAAKRTSFVDYAEAKSIIIQKILERSGTFAPEDLVTISKPYMRGERWGTVQTERLSLREFVLGDVDDYYTLESNEENARYQDWPPRTIDQARELVLGNIQSSYVTPRTSWELVVESEGHMIGRVGAASTEPEADNQSQPVTHLNLWFSFLPSVHGRGFATEAMQALIDELVKRHNGGPVELEIECDPRNTGSWKLAERLGFEKNSFTEKAWESKGEWVDSSVYRKLV
jgi:GrpB-like predicted nucleotidyltransferase (UPF0157 family)/RimJ/RimL family protein N-acetyltransferase